MTPSPRGIDITGSCGYRPQVQMALNDCGTRADDTNASHPLSEPKFSRDPARKITSMEKRFSLRDPDGVSVYTDRTIIGRFDFRVIYSGREETEIPDNDSVDGAELE